MAETKEDLGVRTKRYLKIAVKYAFSHVGLCFLVIGYAIIGALTFQAFESQHEFNERRHERNLREMTIKRELREIERDREECIRELWRITVRMNILYENNWTHLVRTRMKKFEEHILDLKKPTEDKPIEPEPQWTFPGALLYSITVITTIGYGNIAPKTRIGKITTIFYALLGIPLMLLFLSNIGNLLARTFTVLYHISCKLCTRKRGKSDENAKDVCLEEINNHTEAEQIECISSVDISPSENLPKTEINIKTHSEQVEGRKGVPIFVVLLFVTFYICLGALIFDLWEDWDYLDSAYFCFITLSTIGFGDLVPGSSILNPQAKGSQAKLIICCIYLIIGLAFIAMSFNLVQEEVTYKCKNIAKKLGLISSENETK
ncbi:TWiK family of potassium channels protein 7-like [Centruroides sculpturatus]|uniref:TWiK family of potassium channels protein 7-like n=1 Tax=Centruroides sculpturatus TaxID=218467 RepID=UPI000C6E85FF|nr:TWiK family of potassium channels protein 7-like [Centruroides sculpturatus]